eukprot:2457480-Alexandrium_andersonii.AAC.1
MAGTPAANNGTGHFTLVARKRADMRWRLPPAGPVLELERLVEVLVAGEYVGPVGADEGHVGGLQPCLRARPGVRGEHPFLALLPPAVAPLLLDVIDEHEQLDEAGRCLRRRMLNN